MSAKGLFSLTFARLNILRFQYFSFIKKLKRLAKIMIKNLKTRNVYDREPSHYKFHNFRAFSNSGEILTEKFANRFETNSTEIFKFRKLLKNQILIELSDKDFARLMPHLEFVSLAPGDEVYQPDEEMRYVYFPEDLVASQLQGLSDGKTGESAMIGSEGIIGLCAIFGFQRQIQWTQITVGGNAWRIKTDVIKREFNQSAGIQASFLNFVNFLIAQVSQRAICNVHHLIEERLCTWLLMLDDRNKNKRLMLTQDQIANYLGVNRPSISHIAQNLREQGKISYLRGQLHVIDKKGLQDSACECYAAIKDNILSTECAQIM